MFQPGLNEDLAATALWGTQQAEMRGEGEYDGVFGIWYGKGPGVDRSRRRVPPRQCGGHLETWRRAGADGRRSQAPNPRPSRIRSEFALRRCDDADPQSGRRAGDPRLRALWLSRCRASAGSWVGDQMREGHGRIDRRHRRLARPRQDRSSPADFKMPPGGLNIRARRRPSSIRRSGCTNFKRDAALAFVRANKLEQDHHLAAVRNPKIGIITAGKSYLDVRQALDELGIDEVAANDSACGSQDRPALAARAAQGLIEFARGPRPDHRGRGEALAASRCRCARSFTARPNQPVCIGKKDEERQLALPGQWRARAQRDRDRHRRAACCGSHQWRGSATARRAAQAGAGRARRDRPTSRRAPPISAPAARTIPRPKCPRACAPMPASAATGWCSGWTATPRASPRWAARAPTGSARRRSPSARMCSRISATAPTTIPASLAHPRGGRLRRQHHLQDPLQRRGRHDRRPARMRAGSPSA